MPIVKYISEETDLPTNVAREINRYTKFSLVALEEYEKYRNAALKLDAKPIKYNCSDLYAFAESLQENAENESEYNDARSLKWAIGNTKVQYRCLLREIAKEKNGKKWNERQWEEKNPDTGVFEASLFQWHKQDSENRHPAVLLVMLLDLYGYSPKKEAVNGR